MINRILIRSKVVQIAYSYFLTKDKTVMEAEKELFFSFEKSYELYHLLLTLMVELTDTQAARVEAARLPRRRIPICASLITGLSSS